MSKAKRYRRAGRPWVLPGGQLATSPFPGASTVLDVGRQVLHNQGRAYRYMLQRTGRLVQGCLVARDAGRRRASLGGEFNRKRWRDFGGFYRKPSHGVR